MNRFTHGSMRVALVAASLAGTVPALEAGDDTDTEIKALREQIRVLDERLHQLEQKQMLKEQEAAAAAKTAPKISITDRGFTLASGDGANAVSLRGLVQLDSRVFFNGGAGTANNSFVLRRARLISEGTFARIFSFQLVPEFGGSGAPSILDANVGVALGKQVQVKFGKFKAPIGLELLQSDSWTFFDERSLATNLVPNRDVGVQLGGNLAGGTVSYAVGVFNGVADGASSTNADFDNDKDLVVRGFLHPFKDEAGSPLRGLAFGAAASSGRQKSGAALTGGYKTDGQQTFFRYRSTAIADGQAWRLAPQAEYRSGPFGAIGEYVISTANVRPGPAGAKTGLSSRAWQLAAGWVLTGEDSSYNGVSPRRSFNWEDGTWGAWEVAVRYASLMIDPKAFPLFADPSVSASQASSIGIGLNWYLSRTVRTMVDFYQTNFDQAAPASSGQLPRPDETAIISRVQVSF